MTTGLGGSVFRVGGGQGSFGSGVVSVGDVTGDGRADLAVSAVRAEHGGLPAVGAVYLIHGAAGIGDHPATVTLGQTAGASAGVSWSVISGGPAGGGLGTGLAAGGDLDGDGRADLLLSAPGIEGADGQAYALYVPAAGIAASADLDDMTDGRTTRLLTGPGTNAGASVAGLGDFSGDGFGDLLITSAGDGRAYVLLGDGAAHPRALRLDAELDIQRIMFTGVGRHTGSAGDLNGDGIGDLVLSRSAEAGGGMAVIFGSSTLSGVSVNLATFQPDGSQGFLIATDGPGIAVCPGDVDGDRLSDLLVADGRCVVLIRGRQGGFPAVVDPTAPGPGTRFVGGQGVRNMGGMGDVNGDGFNDLVLVGGEGGVDVMHVVFGRAGGLPDMVDLTTLDGTNGYRFKALPEDGPPGGVEIFDLNGDGFGDVAAGMPDAEGGAGSLRIVYGGASRMAALDAADGAQDGRIDLSLLGARLSFDEPDPVQPKGSIGRADPTQRSDDLIGTGGSDTAALQGGNDTYAALAGDDQIWGDAGADLIFGDSGDDLIFGGTGDDTIWGQSGSDFLDGGSGADLLAGGIGNDTICVDASGDLVIEDLNAGTDWVFAAVDCRLPDDVEHLRLTAAAPSAGFGNRLANRMIGNDAANRLSGGAANDRLDGGGGADTLVGGSGKDWMFGGIDDDADHFVFGRAVHSLRGRQRDVIADFDRGDDRVDLQSIDADTRRAGVQDLAFAGTTARANAVWYLETVSGLRLFVDTTGDRRADMEIWMDEVFRLSARDLLL